MDLFATLQAESTPSSPRLFFQNFKIFSFFTHYKQVQLCGDKLRVASFFADLLTIFYNLKLHIENEHVLITTCTMTSTCVLRNNCLRQNRGICVKKVT
jgi:hypothetical protein